MTECKKYRVDIKNNLCKKHKGIKQNQNITFRNDKQALKHSKNQYLIIKKKEDTITLYISEIRIITTCFYNLDKRNSTIELELGYKDSTIG